MGPGRLDTSLQNERAVHADTARVSKNRHADVPIVADVREVIADLIVAVQAEYDAPGHGGRHSPLAGDLPGVARGCKFALL